MVRNTHLLWKQFKNFGPENFWRVCAQSGDDCSIIFCCSGLDYRRQMVLFWRSQHRISLTEIFDRTVEVRMFFFYFGNIEMREKDKKESERDFWIPCWMSLSALFKMYTCNNEFTGEAKKYNVAKRTLIKDFDMYEELQEADRTAKTSFLSLTGASTSLSAVEN